VGGHLIYLLKRLQKNWVIKNAIKLENRGPPRYFDNPKYLLKEFENDSALVRFGV
jgi:hypothetical protein